MRERERGGLAGVEMENHAYGDALERSRQPGA